MSLIAIFGGTFNPVHNGHINFCTQCDKFFDFSKIMLIPTNIPPHKNPLHLVSNEHRYNMLNLAIKDNRLKKFVVNDIELKKNTVSYSIDTILELKEQHPDDEFYFLMGTDMFLIFDKWYKYDLILQNINIVVGQREINQSKQIMDCLTRFSKYKDKIFIANINVLPMSSTQIREKIRENKDLEFFLDKKVVKYIKDNNLYE